ncbi:helix-turn-helix domain-containing protein [Vibrio alginolyticus]
MKPTTKQERALRVLELLGEGKSVPEIASVLGRPQSTIYKHITAFRYLTGKEGVRRQHLAFNSLFYVRMGLSQREVARSKLFGIDHKFISDLCAMDWAINRLLENINMEAISAMIERGLEAERRDRTAIREPLGVLTEAFDEVLIHLPDEMSPELEDAITDLTEAVIEVESLLKHP